MKLMTAGVVLLLLASAGAEAFPFKSRDRLPKPIDSPIVRPKLRGDHKAGKRTGRHPSQYQRPDWGALWGETLSLKRAHPIPEYLKQPF